MIVLADNDVVVKLAAADLCDQLAPALGVTTDDVRLLPSASHYFARSRAALARHGPEAMARAAAFARALPPLEVPIDDDEYRRLHEVPDIDEGEAVLFAATRSSVDVLLVTGDKRSLRALAAADHCRQVSGRLAGRVICFEQIVLALIDHLGFTAVRDRFLPVLNTDTALRAAFGAGEAATAANVVAVLNEYVAELRRSTGNLLATGYGGSGNIGK